MKNQLKRILIFLIVVIFISLYFVAIFYALRGGDNALSIIVGIISSIGVGSILIFFILKFLRYMNEKDS